MKVLINDLNENYSKVFELCISRYECDITKLSRYIKVYNLQDVIELVQKEEFDLYVSFEESIATMDIITISQYSLLSYKIKNILKDMYLCSSSSKNLELNYIFDDLYFLKNGVEDSEQKISDLIIKEYSLIKKVTELKNLIPTKVDNNTSEQLERLLTKPSMENKVDLNKLYENVDKYGIGYISNIHIYQLQSDIGLIDLPAGTKLKILEDLDTNYYVEVEYKNQLIHGKVNKKFVSI